MPTLRSLEMNTLFARAVLEHEAPGRVLVDSVDSPSVILVAHGYGMSLLFGREDVADLDDAVLAQLVEEDRREAEWLQVSPARRAGQIARFSASRTDPRAPAVEQYTRVNFELSLDEYRARRPHLTDASQHVVPVDRASFALSGSVVPRAFWPDVDRFLETGAGFVVMVANEPASLAFSSFVTSTQLEIGIETLGPHRGRGLATSACVALIDHCLANALEPVWACRLENTASHRLAERLGFVPVRRLPYFRLPPRSRDADGRA